MNSPAPNSDEGRSIVEQARVRGGGKAASWRVRDLANPHYKWIVLSNTTLGVLMASINASILLIALPDIFRGVGINPLAPGNTSLLLWSIMGYMVVTAVLIVSFGRLVFLVSVPVGLFGTV